MKRWTQLLTLLLIAALFLNGIPALAAGKDTALLVPAASGTAVKQNSRASIDYSNAKDGYVMACFTGSSSKKLRAQVVGPKTTYTYVLTPGQWATFPLSEGNGNYKVAVYENVSSTKFAEVISASFTATLTDEFTPFLRPNQYVDYAPAEKTVAKARELADSETDPLKLVERIYNFVVNGLTYDKQLAAKVTTGYLPVLDKVLESKKGICFDYASLMTGMLRSLGVPCKLVVGYSGKVYHAWISVWTEESGWIENIIFFDGKTWQRMDPTFASSGKQSKAIMNYIGDGSHYSAKYIY